MCPYVDTRAELMKPKLAEAIVGFLSFSGEACDQVPQLKKFSERHWNRTQGWLDDTGLALYFLHKLKDTGTANVVPSLVLSGLEKRFTANQKRVAYMARQFEFLNAKFHDRGVRYAVVKGFSLVPQFCPDARNLRHQGDFDYLVDDESLPMAQRIPGGSWICSEVTSYSSLGVQIPDAFNGSSPSQSGPVRSTSALCS